MLLKAGILVAQMTVKAREIIQKKLKANRTQKNSVNTTPAGNSWPHVEQELG